MNQKNALLLCFIFGGGLITAQTDTFELGSYKARYERRPAMLLDGGMAFSGNYAENNTARNTGQASGRLLWREQRNTDELISSWYLSGNLMGNLNQNFSPANGRYSTGTLTVLSQWDRYHYRPGNRFWGWGGVFGTDGRLAFFDERAAWASLLELDYFINYQWSFRLRASSNLLYQLDTGLLSLMPNFTFNTVYYFF